jgi:hypothetical protein
MLSKKTITTIAIFPKYETVDYSCTALPLYCLAAGGSPTLQRQTIPKIFIPQWQHNARILIARSMSLP